MYVKLPDSSKFHYPSPDVRCSSPGFLGLEAEPQPTTQHISSSSVLPIDLSVTHEASAKKEEDLLATEVEGARREGKKATGEKYRQLHQYKRRKRRRTILHPGMITAYASCDGDQKHIGILFISVYHFIYLFTISSITKCT